MAKVPHPEAFISDRSLVQVVDPGWDGTALGYERQRPKLLVLDLWGTLLGDRREC